MGLKISEKMKAVISSIAPTLGVALGGPFGGLAGSILAKTLGGGDSNVEAQAEAQLEAQSPETLLKLKAAEKELLLEMERLDISREQLEYNDRADARKRDLSLGGDMTTKVLAYVVVGAFVAMAAGILFGKLVAESALAGSVIGYLSAKAEQVIAFYFGSSAGSKQKTEALAQAAIRK